MFITEMQHYLLGGKFVFAALAFPYVTRICVLEWVL